MLSGLMALSSLTLATVARATPLDNMASPVSNPVNFEDPRIESNIKPFFAYHKIDKAFVTGGGDVRIYALQARIALSEKLAIIATKDGIANLHPDAALKDETGFLNLAAGVKYNFYKNEENTAMMTAGLRYEAPTGEREVLQGNGDGIINPFLSGAAVFGCDDQPINLIYGTGLRIPVNSNDSFFYDADLHVDTKYGWFSPLLEVNLVQVLNAGERLPIYDEGQDVFNIGSSNSKGETMLTGAAGFRIALADNVSWGTAYQFPLVHGRGTRITDWRLTTDLTVTF